MNEPQTSKKNLNRPAVSSRVEQLALERSLFQALYPPAEKIATIVVDNFPALGKLAAMRFLEWLQQNPEGVVSLPTGKTPEYFIKWVSHLLTNWEQADVRAELEKYGIDPAVQPRMDQLRFVQIDEFYPMPPQQKNSFHYYINHFYLEQFGLDRKKALLIDCTKIGIPPGESLDSLWPEGRIDPTLRHRAARTDLERKQKRALEEIDQWCQEYEEAVRRMGGIGFFLGGIGPDGHIGFNVRGSDHYSSTRLTPTNYETQAAAAGDLGGMETSRDRLVITIGLRTITFNPHCVAIILAAGATKAPIVAKAVQAEKHVLIPASALQDLPNARFYVTRSAASLLPERRLHQLECTETISDEAIERLLVELAIKRQKMLVNLTAEDLGSDRLVSAALAKREESPETLARIVRQRLIDKIECGAGGRTNTRFLHTEPHHDDLMLGYLPYIVRHVRDAANEHRFATLTSGFTAVTNDFMNRNCECLRRFLETSGFKALLQEKYFAPADETGRNRDVWQYLDGVAAENQEQRDEGSARRFLRNLSEVYGETDPGAIAKRIAKLEHYFQTAYPGKKDPKKIQRLKGMCREWEAECLWGYFGWNCANVRHLRLGFYTGDIFTEEPTMERDVAPLVSLLEESQPEVISVVLDPEASGPDTHYKALQAMTEAVKRYQQSRARSGLKILGYRNVWHRFHPSEANIFVPVSLNMFSVMQSAFRNTFVSQKDAPFPSYEHDGPFCQLAQQIQVDQYQAIKTCLGRKWFHEHSSPLIRATRGFVFLKEMDLEEFYHRSRKLREATVMH